MKQLLFLIVTVISLGQNLAQSPVAYYPFSGNANDAAGSNNGTVNGATLSTDRFGNANSAYSFDGVDDHISCNFGTNLSSAFTVSCWFKMPSLPPANTVYEILSKRSLCASSFTDFPFGLSVNSSGIVTALFSKGDDFIAEHILQSIALSVNQWYFITVAYNANNSAELYIDGALTASEVIDYAISTNSQNWTIGRASQENLSGCPFTNTHTNGSIDEVKIYDTALTAGQVLADYNSVTGQNYRSITTGDWSSPSTWERFDGTSFVPATTAPSSADGLISIRIGHNVTINGDVTVDQVVVDAGGTLTKNSRINLNNGVGSDLTVNGTLIWNGENIVGNGEASIGVTGLLNISTGSTKTIGVNLTNNGTIDWQDGIINSSVPGLTMTNNGLFTISGNNSTGNVGGVGNFTFINNGTLTKTSSGTTVFSSFSLNNSGTLNINAGSLVSSAGTINNSAPINITNATLEINADATLNWNAGSVLNGTGLFSIAHGAATLVLNDHMVVPASVSFMLAGPVTGVGNLTCNGPLTVQSDISGTGTLVINENSTWNAGTMGRVTTIASGKTLTIASGTTRIIAGNLTNNGTIDWQNGIINSSLPGLTITNGGLFTISGNNSTGNVGGVGNFTFINSGTLTKASSGTTVFSSFSLNNPGTLNINAGSLVFFAGTINNSTPINITNATLEINADATLNWNPGSVLNGSGVFSINHGSATLVLNDHMVAPASFSFILAGPVTGVGNLTCNGPVTVQSNVSGTGTLAINENCSWNAGTMGRVTTIASGKTLTIASGASRFIAANFINNGTISWQDGNLSFFPAGLTLTNNGLFTISGNNITGNNGGVGDLTIINNGTLAKTSGGTTVLNHLFCTNNGTIKGIGTYDFNNNPITGAGSIAPGLSPGILTMNGQQPLTANGTLAIEIQDGTGPGTGHDQLQRNTNLTLTGTLTVSETGSVPFGTYTIIDLTSGTISGAFSTISLPALYTLQVNATSVTVTKAPPMSASTDFYRSISTGTWGSLTTWESSPVADFATGLVSPATLIPNELANVITIRNGHNVTVASPVTVDQVVVETGGTLTQSAGISLNDGAGNDLSVSGTWIWNENLVSGTGNAVIALGGLLNLATGNDKTLATTISNNGTTNWQDGLLRSSVSGLLFTNNGLFTISGNNGTDQLNGTGNFNFINNGTITKTSNGGTGCNHFSLTNTGTLNVNAGTLVFTNGTINNSGSIALTGSTLSVDAGITFNWNTGSSITGSGTLNFLHPSSTLALNDNMVVPSAISTVMSSNVSGTGNLTVNGPLTVNANIVIGGSGTLAINENSTWNGGSINRITIMATSKTLTINSGNDKSLGADFVNNGTIDWQDGLLRSSVAGLIFTNNGLFTISGNNGTEQSNGTGNFNFINNGTITKTSNGGTGCNHFSLTNTGTLNVNAGTLVFANGTINNLSPINLINAAIAVNEGVTFNWNAGSSLNGSGSFSTNHPSSTLVLNDNCVIPSAISLTVQSSNVVGSGNLTCNGPLTISQPSCFIGGTGTLAINENSTWNGGTINRITTMATGKTLTINSGNDISLGANFVNNGTIDWQDGLFRSLVAGLIFTNNGLFTISGNNGTDQQNGTGNFNFINVGTLQKTSTGTTSFNHFTCTNNGTIQGLGTYNLMSSPISGTGVIAPGLSPGILTIIGQQPFSANSTLAIEIQDGSGPGTGNDQLQRNSDLTLTGTLIVTETGSVPFGTFTIINLTSGTISGAFSTVSLPALYTLQVNATSVTVTKAPPTSATTDFYRSITSGTWGSLTTWESSPVADFATGLVSPATLIPNELANVITIRNGHNVTVASSVTIDQVVVAVGGTLTQMHDVFLSDGAGDDLTVNGTMDWQIGAQINPGNVSISSGGVLNITTASNKHLRLNVTNNGTIDWQDGNILFGNNATVTNNGSWLITGNNATQAFFSRGFIVNNGTITKSSAGATSFTGVDNFANTSVINYNAGSVDFSPLDNGTPFTNTGSLVFNGGSFINNINGAFNHNAGSAISGTGSFTNNGLFNLNIDQAFPATLVFANTGTIMGVGNLTINNVFTILGNIAGSGTLTIDANSTWISGQVARPFTVQPTRTLTINTAANKFIAADIVNNGIVDWQDGNILFNVLSSVTNNQTWTISGNNATGANVARGLWVNNGTMTKTSAGATSFAGLNSFTNTSVINFNAGTVDFSPSDNGTPFTNSGNLVFNSGTLTTSGAAVLNNNTGAYIKGNGTLLVSGPFNNTGIVSPGLSPGIITLNGAQPFSPTSALNIEILDGTGPGSGHDQLQRNTNLTLNGTLTVTETGSVPAGSYTIISLTSGTISGAFTSLNLPACYTLQVNSTTVVVTKSAIANAGIVSGTTPLCVADGATYTSNGDPGGTWSSSNIAVATVNATTGAVAAIGAGTCDIRYTVTTGCNSPTTASKVLTVNATTTSNAGPDKSTCGTNAVTLAAVGSGTWNGGLGAFSNVNLNNSTYTPASGEIGTTVSLTWTVTGTSPCPNATDQMTVSVITPATSNAGVDKITCGTNPVLLAAIGTGVWSGGAGTFSNSNANNSSYTPNASEIGSSVNLTWTVTGTSPCPNAADQMVVTVVTPASSNAGPDKSTCGINAVTLAAVGTGIWSGGMGAFSSTNSNNSTYTPNVSEVGTTVTLTWTVTGTTPCPDVMDQMAVNVVTPATSNAGVDKSTCGTNPVILAAAGTGVWSGGAGIFSNTSASNSTYTPNASEIGSSVTLTWTVSGTAPCPSATDQMLVNVITPATSNAGVDKSTCGTTAVALAAVGSGTWSGGLGTFSNTNLNSSTYTPTLAEVGTSVMLTWTVTGSAPCPNATDQMVVTVVAPGNPNAGADKTTCGTNAVTLSATGAGDWSGGLGTFSNTNLNNSTYSPAVGEVGTVVTLTWTVTGNAPCPSGTDQMTVTVVTPTSSNAGPDKSTCGNNPVALAAVGAGVWSGGAGTFSNISANNSTYTPNASEVGSSVNLTWTVTGASPCPNATDQTVVTVVTPASSNAGPDKSTCGTNPVTLAAVGTGVWSGGAGAFSNTNSSTSTYTPNVSEVGAAVTLTWTVTGTTPCPNVTDQMTVNVITPASSNAGVDKSTCGTNPVTLAAAGTGVWSGGTGTFSNSSANNSSYTPNVSEVGTSVTLTWTVTGTSPCPNVTDQMTVSVITPAAANAGVDKSTCGTNPVNLAAIGAGVWSGGAGTFGNTSANNSTYTPNASEIGSSVTLTWTVTGTAPCPNVTDQMTVSVITPATSNAGVDKTTCGTNPVTLAAIGTGVWSGGTGTFSNTSANNSSYTPNVSEIGSFVTLTWTVTGTSPCPNVTDQMTVSVSNNGEINLQGNGVSIVTGDVTPDPSDHTDFETVAANTSLTRVFTIQNLGSANLTVTSVLSDNSFFTVGAVSPSGPIGAGSAATFSLTFAPTNTTGQIATITVNNLDCNESTYTFKVQGNNNCTPPSFISCPSAVTVSTSNNSCMATVSYSALASGIPTPTLSYSLAGQTSGSGAGSGSGSALNKGVTTVTVLASNGCGVNANCIFSVTVNDSIKPVAKCKNVALTLNNSGTVQTNAAAVNNASTDNCGGIAGIQSLSLSKTTFNCSNFGVNTVVLTATDNSQNLATCSATVMIGYAQLPVAKCKNAILVLSSAGNGSITGAGMNNASTDLCSANGLTFGLSKSTFNCANVGANVVVLTVTNVAGSSSTCTGTVTVKDLTKPVAKCKAITIPLTAGNSVTIQPSQVNDGCTDACTNPPNLSLNQSVFTCANNGPNVVVLKATDASNNFQTCSAVVTINCSNNQSKVDATNKQLSAANDDGFELFPNPASREVVVRLNKAQEQIVSLSIFDYAGKLVVTKEMQIGLKQITIDLEDASFHSGIYLMHLILANGVQTKQFVVFKD